MSGESEEQPNEVPAEPGQEEPEAALVPPTEAAEAAEPPEAPAAAERAGSAGEEVPGEVTRLAEAVAGLDDLAEQPVAEHVVRYDALHTELAEALASIDEV